MTTTVIDSIDKKPVDKKALTEYSREIVPMIKDLLYKKDLQKDFRESDDTAIDLAEAVKMAQTQLKEYLEKDDTYKELDEQVKERTREIKEALKGAARVCEFKPAELQAFFQARVKEAVKKTVDKGQVFAELNNLLDEV